MIGRAARHAWRLVRNLGSRRRREADLDAELRACVELLADEREQAGEGPAEARRRARAAFGSVEAVKDEVRDVRAGAWVEGLCRDLRHGLRMMRRDPGFTAVAVMTLALAIGANTAVFSVVRGVLLRPLPYGDADRVVMFHNADAEGTFDLSERERLIYRDRAAALASLSAYDFWSATLTGDGDAERLRTAYVDVDLFATLGAPVALGRPFADDDAVIANGRVAILSHELWTRRFGASPEAVGRTLEIDGRPVTVVGVMPAGFRLPLDFGGEPAALLRPLSFSGPPDPDNIHYLHAVARLAPGVGLAAAAERLDAVAARVKEEIGTLPDSYHVSLVPVARQVLGDVRPGLWLVSGAVGLLLAIACANLANLLLARARSREGELALRASLGARRGRLVRQMLTESVLLSAIGGVLGLAVAAVTTRALVARAPRLPRLEQIGIDTRVLGFAAIVTVLAGLTFGIVPALRLARSGLAAAARQGGGGTPAASHRGTGRLLVAAEVALAVVLAAGAGLLLRSAVALARVEPGLDPHGVITLRTSLPASSYRDRTSTRDFYARLLSSLRRLPAVRAAGAVTHLPLASDPGDWGIQIDGRPDRRVDGLRANADWMVATDGYFAAMGIPLLAGRTFTTSDRADTLPVIVINQRMASDYWPDGSALGARVRMTTGIDPVWREVIGIVGDVRHYGLDAPPQRQMFLPHSQFYAGGGRVAGMTIAVRGDGDPAALAPAVRAALREIDPHVPAAEVRPMREVVDASTSVRRFYVWLVGLFAALALVLVAVGVYGVTAYRAAGRAHEIGIRLALGATGARVVRLIAGEGAVVAAVGIAAGTAAAAGAGGLIASQLYGVTPADPATLTAVPALVAALTLAAGLVPALRATRVDPLASLRQD